MIFLNLSRPSLGIISDLFRPDITIMESNKKLRLITYLSPDIPLGLYQAYQHYLDEVLHCQSYLMVESRWSGPSSDRPNPFTDNDADIGECWLNAIDSDSINKQLMLYNS